MPTPHIIEDGQVIGKNPPGPLNGLEFKELILERVKKSLDGEHGIFNVARCWPHAEFQFSIEIRGFSEQPEEIEVEWKFADPNKPSSEVNTEEEFEGEGDTENPDELRKQLGLPVQSSEDHRVETDFSGISQAIADSGKGLTSVKVRRGR